MGQRRNGSIQGPKAKPSLNQRLLHWHEIEPWQQGNPYIRSGYRPLSHSYIKSLWSAARLHNQTVNIHTHLIGLVLFALGAVALWHEYAYRHVSVTYADAFAFGIFFTGLFLCLSMSAAYHTFANHSRDVCEGMLLCDLLGILGLITASWIPGIFYGFLCQQSVTRFFWAMIATIVSGCAITVSVPAFRHPTWDAFRTGMFLSLGLAGILPMTYAAMRYGVSQAHKQMGWGWFALEGVIYTTGTAIYAARVPERWAPGRFDIYGSSHQIFHVLVLGGALAHLVGVLTAFEYNHNPLTRVC